MSVIRNVELVMWSTRGEPPTVADVRAALQQYGFSAERAEDIPETTAFRRAVKAKEVKQESRVTVWDNGRIHAQLDRLIQDGDRIRREFVESWKMAEDGTVIGSPLDVAERRLNYIWSDVGSVIRQVLDKDSLGAYTPRKAGGVYFVPVRSKDFLDRLENVCRSIGLLFLRYQIPDTEEQRSEVADAVFQNLTLEIDAHEVAVKSYAHDRTPAGFVRNRDDSIAATVSLIGRLAEHLGGRATALTERCAALRKQCEEMVAAIESYRPVSSGRRIVTTPVAAPTAQPSMFAVTVEAPLVEVSQP